MPSRPLVTLALLLAAAAGLSGCGEPALDDAESRLGEVQVRLDDEMRGVVEVLDDAGVDVERADGHVESTGMSTWEAREYSARALLVADPTLDKQAQATRVVDALEQAGWRRTAGDLADPLPWAQLERDDLLAKVEWQRVSGDFVLDLDRVGPDSAVRFPDDAPEPARDDSRPIDLG